MNEKKNRKGKKKMKKLTVLAATVLLLTGCGNGFAGEYQFDNSSETLVVKSDGTCVDKLSGGEIACTWTQVGNGKYTISMKTWLGTVNYDVEKVNSKDYNISAMGVSTTMHKK